MVRKNATPQMVSEILHQIFEAENQYILNDENRFVVSRSEANMIMARIMEFGLKIGLLNSPRGWGGRYLIGLYHGAYPEIPKIIGAVLMAYAQTMDDVPAVLVGLEETKIFSPAGSVRPGTVVKTKSVKCGRTVCPVHFIKNAPNQKYCCPRCGYLDRKKTAEQNGNGGKHEKH